jgi:hydroxymethylpyrimidine/phosphomethylpyrimidine kinase
MQKNPSKSSSPLAKPPLVLTIAGFDPSSGAGVTADLKVFAAHGLYGTAAVTALTVQSTQGVRRSDPVAPDLLAETLACLAEDLPVAGVKIGMLATSANVGVVAAFLGDLRSRAQVLVVLDPVLRSSSGHPLLEPHGLARISTELLPQVDCVTPNTGELLLLSGSLADEPVGPAGVQAAAARLRELFPHLAVVATGGHLTQPNDYIVAPGCTPEWIEAEWVETPATHGTGCAHSSALLCGLVSGLPIHAAARSAKEYVTDALRAAMPMGRGGGAMNHLHKSGEAFSPFRPSSQERSERGTLRKPGR